jgi:DNA replication licensing factor MCM6
MTSSFTEDVALADTPTLDGDVRDTGDGDLIYIEQIHTLRECELTTLYVDFGHLLRKDEVLADAIQKQYYRFLPYLRRALHNLVARYEPDYLKINPTAATTDSVNLQSREFNVAFYHLPLVSGIRELRTDKIGMLMSISGTVTRTSEVRPELLYGSFICEVCGGFVPEVEQQFKYTEVSDVSCIALADTDHRCISQVSVRTCYVATGPLGNFKSILPSSQTGRRSVFRKIRQKYLRDPCHDLWM